MVAAVALPIALAFAVLIANAISHIESARALTRNLRWLVSCEIGSCVLLALIGFFYEHTARRRDAKLYHPPGKLVDIGGYRLHINCIGAGGPLVVLEYGLEASYLDWRLVQPEVARFARVGIYDRAGYGWSDPSPGRRLPSVMSQELHSLLHAAGEPPPYILVAHSFGSYNAVMFAHLFPEEVLGLVLVDGMHTLSDFPFSVKKRIAIRTIQMLMPFGLPRWRGWCGGTGPAELRAERQAITCRAGLYGTFYDENASLSASAQQVRAITSLGDIPLIVLARDPTLNDSGDRSRWELIQKQKLSLSTRSELIVASGSGHDVPLKRPDLIVAAVRKLATQASGTGGQPGNSLRNVLPM